MQFLEKKWYTLNDVCKERSCEISYLLHLAETQQLELCFRRPANNRSIFYIAIFSSEKQSTMNRGLIDIKVSGQLPWMKVMRDWCGITTSYEPGKWSEEECKEQGENYGGCPEDYSQKCRNENFEEWFVLTIPDAKLLAVHKTAVTVATASQVYSDRFKPFNFKTKFLGMPNDAKMCEVHFVSKELSGVLNEKPKYVPSSMKILLDQLVILPDEFRRFMDNEKIVSDQISAPPVIHSQNSLEPTIQAIPKDKNPVWQTRMEELVSEYKKDGKKGKPTKEFIAIKMSKELNISEGTIMRKTSKTW